MVADLLDSSGASSLDWIGQVITSCVHCNSPLHNLMPDNAQFLSMLHVDAQLVAQCCRPSPPLDFESACIEFDFCKSLCETFVRQSAFIRSVEHFSTVNHPWDSFWHGKQDARRNGIPQQNTWFVPMIVGWTPASSSQTEENTCRHACAHTVKPVLAPLFWIKDPAMLDNQLFVCCSCKMTKDAFACSCA